MVLVAFIESVVSAFHEDLRPLNKGRSKKTGEGADDDFLDKRGVHVCFYSSDGATLWLSGE